MLRIGLFGVGRWGTNILNTLNALKGVAVIAVDSKNFSQIPVDPHTIDGVIIATPGSTHAAVALPFITAGIPTYIEKPLTTSLTDARALEKAAQKSGGIVFSGHLHRYNPAYKTARKHVLKAGNIRYLYFEGTNNGPFRDDMSALWDWAPHDVYLAMDLLNGDIPTHVQAWGIKTLRPDTDLYDFSVMKMTFPNGTEAISTTSWLLPIKQKKVTIIGEKNTVVFDDAGEKKVVVYKEMGPAFAKAAMADKPLAVLKQEPKIMYPSYSNKSPLQAELEEFLGCIRTGKQPLTGLADGVNVVRVLAAAEKSMQQEGRKVKLSQSIT